MLLSGACDGADETFGEMAMQHKHRLVHFLGPGDEEWASAKAKEKQSHAFQHVKAELLQDKVVSEAFDRAGESRVLGSQRTPDWRARVAEMASRRNFLQVRCADVVYVVGWRLQEGKDQFFGRSDIDPRETPILDVGGGTGWACQWYVDRFAAGGEDPSQCKLFFFDDAGPPWARKDPATEGKWSRWNVTSKAWEQLEEGAPKPSGLYAGIGATRLSSRAEGAIRGLYRDVAATVEAEKEVDQRGAKLAEELCERWRSELHQRQEEHGRQVATALDEVHQELLGLQEEVSRGDQFRQEQHRLFEEQLEHLQRIGARAEAEVEVATAEASETRRMAVEQLGVLASQQSESREEARRQTQVATEAASQAQLSAQELLVMLAARDETQQSLANQVEAATEGTMEARRSAAEFHVALATRDEIHDSLAKQVEVATEEASQAQCSATELLMALDARSTTQEGTARQTEAAAVEASEARHAVAELLDVLAAQEETQEVLARRAEDLIAENGIVREKLSEAEALYRECVSAADGEVAALRAELQHRGESCEDRPWDSDRRMSEG